MKTISAALAVLLLLWVSLAGWRLLSQPGAYIVGGSSVIHSGEVVDGDLVVVFADVTLEQGAHLNGRVLSVSSALDLAGGVNGDILAVASDLTPRATASLMQAPREVKLIPFVLLLPPVARAGAAN